jgi:signal recognition particle GTPase
MQQLNSNQEVFRSKIAQWKAGLADTGRGNPLIKFRQDGPRSLEIFAEKPGELYALLIKKKSLPFQMEETENSSLENKAATKSVKQLTTYQSASERLKRLKKLRLEAKRSIEERGVNSLFLAFGTLSWFDKDKTKEDDVLRSPLILVPVELEKEPRRDIYHLKLSGEEPVINPTLALKLKQIFGIDFPEGDALENKSYSDLIKQIRDLVSKQKNWQVEDRIFLSLFSYAKAAMVRDLIENEQRILEHPILQAISGDLTAYQSTYQEPLPASALDQNVKPDQIFQILDADSSQQVVIEAAKQGTSFVVQGPPGTGKSQTIVNMIAELVGSGKSVLLVAEKETALSVVYERMVTCNLGHLCLNLHHSSTKDRRKFVQELSQSILDVDQHLQNSSSSTHKNFFDDFIASRQILSSYLEGLHTKEQPLDKSAFELFGIILEFKRQAIPYVDVTLSKFGNFTPDNLSKAKSLIDKLAKYKDYFHGSKINIWSQTPLKEYSFGFELQVREQIDEIRCAVNSVKELSHRLIKTFQILPVLNLESLEEVLEGLSYVAKAPIELSDNWSNINVSEATTVLNALRDDVRFLESCEPSLKQRYFSELFSPHLSELSARYHSCNLWILDVLFNPKYRSDRSYLERIFRSKNKPLDDQFKLDLRNAIKVQSIREKFRQEEFDAKEIWGAFFEPEISKQADLRLIEEEMIWLKGLDKYPFLGNISVENAIKSSGKRDELSQIIIQLENKYTSISKGFEFLECHFDLHKVDAQNGSSRQIEFHILIDFLNTVEQDLDDLQEWIEYQDTIKKLDKLGVKKFLDRIRPMDVEAEQWFPMLKRTIFQTCLNSILAAKPELKNFDIEVYDRQIQDFSVLDYTQLEIARDRLRDKHGKYWQSWQMQSIAQSQLNRLKIETNKKRCHSTIRKILNDATKGIPELVKVLKPCWMMSPLSVSQYIDPEVLHFDV